jgi:hypothetical protein
MRAVASRSMTSRMALCYQIYCERSVSTRKAGSSMVAWNIQIPDISVARLVFSMVLAGWGSIRNPRCSGAGRCWTARIVPGHSGSTFLLLPLLELYVCSTYHVSSTRRGLAPITMTDQSLSTSRFGGAVVFRHRKLSNWDESQQLDGVDPEKEAEQRL